MTSLASKITEPSGLTIREVRGLKSTPAYALFTEEYVRSNFMVGPLLGVSIVPRLAGNHKILG